MPLRAVLTLDGARIGSRAVDLQKYKNKPLWVRKKDLADAVAGAASPSLASAVLASLPDGPLVGLAPADGEAHVTAGPVPLSLIPATPAGGAPVAGHLPAVPPFATSARPAPPGTLIAFAVPGGAGPAARLGVRVEEVPENAGGAPVPEATSKKRSLPSSTTAPAALSPPPPPPPRPRRSGPHAKTLAALAAAAAEAPRGSAPLAGLIIAMLDPDPHLERAACFATRLGAALAWLAPDEPLTAFPASQAVVLAGHAGGGGGGAGHALTPYTHIVAQDPASGSAKARLRGLGLLPPRVARPPTQATQTTHGTTQGTGTAALAAATAAPPPPPPQPPQPAWAPPPGAALVVGVDWLHACNKARAALDAAPYALAWRESTLAKEARQAGLGGPGVSPGTSPASAKKQRTAVAGTPAGAPVSPPAAAPPRLPPGFLPPPLPPPVPCSADAACALIAADAAAYAHDGDGPGVTTAATGRTARHGRVVTWASTAPRPRQGGLPAAAIKWTGGDSGLPWGAGDVWVEPFDPDAMRHTLDAIYIHWMPSRKKKGAAAGAAGGGGGGGGGGPGPSLTPPAGDSDTDDHSSGSDEDEYGGIAPSPGAPLRLNGVCGHAACAARPFCLVCTLREAGDALYSKTGGAGGAGFFKGRALRLGVDALVAWPIPLRTRADVDALRTAGPGGAPKPLGDKTYQKIWEVLSSGRLERLEMARADPLAVARKALTSVWGVGEAAAGRWVAAGLRTVADLAAEAALPGGGRVGTLTHTQRLGLAHYDDFCCRIPAVEVDAVVAAARAVAFEVLGCDERGHRPGVADPAAAAPAHVRACGSWLRAHALCDIPAAARGLAAARQADYGDVDLLISPPPPAPDSPAAAAGPPTSPAAFTAAAEAATRECHALLRSVLEGLASRGFDIQGANTDDWHAFAPGRVARRVGRATLQADVATGGATGGAAGDGAWFHHLTSPPPGRPPAATTASADTAVPGAPASWMGAIRLPADHPALRGPPGEPARPRRWRRLDAKVYSRSALPAAVSYFTGYGSFNRALRHWAKASPTARATALAAAGPASRATGWHLSDTRLFPISLADDKDATRRPVGPPAPLTCETDIFAALGLAYVPPFCRTFTNRTARERDGRAAGP